MTGILVKKLQESHEEASKRVAKTRQISLRKYLRSNIYKTT